MHDHDRYAGPRDRPANYGFQRIVALRLGSEAHSQPWRPSRAKRSAAGDPSADTAPWLARMVSLETRKPWARKPGERCGLWADLDHLGSNGTSLAMSEGQNTRSSSFKTIGHLNHKGHPRNHRTGGVAKEGLKELPLRSVSSSSP